MKSVLDTVKGRIVGYDPVTKELTIKARYDDVFTLAKREYKECLVQLVDSRNVSDKQRRACYAMLREISDYTGNGMELTKEYLKLKYMVEDLQQTAGKIFSLSDAPMSLVCGFQRYLVNFIIEMGIPTKRPLLNMVDDVDSYVYACLVKRVCCICGKPADLHHRDAIGMGRDRKHIVHEGLEVLPLCRIHHTEMHAIGDRSFLEKYHLNGGIKADKAICKTYNLKINKDEID